jgi:DNA-binding response OmpR family regulator/two-component sensor histidine kinase
VGVQQKLYPSQLEFVTFIDSIVKSYQESMKNKNISITFHSDVDKCFVEVDISKIEAVVNNLLSNACKFSTDNGEVKVSLSLLQAESEGTQNICLKVIDNGIGIPANDLPHIFERFYQVSKNQPMNENGSGIGLSIVKDNVELHHGAIHVESEEGKGTSFYVTIPVIQIGKNVNENTSILLDKDESDCKVLIVEDNVDIAHFIMQNLRDIECLVAYNGKMGAEMALQYLPDIIIADIMMPVLNGMEMTKQLKMNIATSTIPIIILTAKDDKKTESELLALGVEAFISKPFEMKELTIHIERILRNKYRLVRKLKEEEKILENKMMITESADEKFLKYITDVIEQNISNSDLNVAKLAELSGYNSKQIYRRVKQLTGYTTVDYIKGIRMKKAAMLLSQKQFMISEVMYMVGYSDSSYFSKCFVEKYGKTPKQYMESK